MAAGGDTRTKRDAIGQIITPGIRRRLVVLTALGFSSGLPLALTDSTLQAWLAETDIDIKTIGLFSLVTLPYVLKFLWAPLLDRFCPPWLGRRRGWMAASQLVVIAVILALALQNPTMHIMLFAWLALGLALASATQDIAVDAYRAEILRPSERGLGAGLSIAGYRVALMVAGAGTFILADRVGFGAAYATIAGVAVVGLAATLAAHESTLPVERPRDLHAAMILPFRAFFQRRHAVALLALVCLYKLGDAAAGRLGIAFFVRALDFSLTEVGAIYKGLGIAITLPGGIFGGILMFRWGLYRSLMIFAVLQTISNLGFLVLALTAKSYVMTVIVIALENFSGGMGTAALVALLMAICDQRYTATQFALLTGAASLGRVFVGPPAGLFVEMWGWSIFFGATVLIALPGIILLRRLRETIIGFDTAITRHASTR